MGKVTGSHASRGATKRGIFDAKVEQKAAKSKTPKDAKHSSKTTDTNISILAGLEFHTCHLKFLTHDLICASSRNTFSASASLNAPR